LNVLLSGITNDSKDPSVDTFKSVAFHILKRFGVDFEAMSLKIESRGLPPNGGGEVVLSLPIVQSLSVSFSTFIYASFQFILVAYISLPSRQLIGSTRVLLKRFEELRFQPKYLHSLKLA